MSVCMCKIAYVSRKLLACMLIFLACFLEQVLVAAVWRPLSFMLAHVIMHHFWLSQCMQACILCAACKHKWLHMHMLTGHREALGREWLLCTQSIDPHVIVCESMHARGLAGISVCTCYQCWCQSVSLLPVSVSIQVIPVCVGVSLCHPHPSFYHYHMFWW